MLSADGAGALFYLLLLANFVDGASTYIYIFFFSIFFSNERANPKTRNQFGVALQKNSV